MTYTGKALSDAMLRLARKHFCQPEYDWCECWIKSDTVAMIRLGDFRGSRGQRLRHPRRGTVTAPLYLSDAEIAVEVLRWQAETGSCVHCGGSGTNLTSWSAETGAVYGPCGKCQGTGRAA